MREIEGVLRDREIGNYYLSNLLSSEPKGRLKDGINFLGHILGISDAFKRHTSIDLPTSLVEKMGLSNLSWLRFANDLQRGLPILYAGTPSPHDTSLDSALATIEITRRVDIDRSGKERRTSNNPLFEPLFVRIAGVIDNRVVGLTYDCKDSSRLTHLSVSYFGGEEVPCHTLPVTDREYFIHMLEVRLDPPPLYDPYTIPALLTPAMIDRVGRPTNALFFQLTPLSDQILPGLAMADAETDWDYHRQFSETLGYSAKPEGEMIVVRIAPSCEISVPEKLIRVG